MSSTARFFTAILAAASLAAASLAAAAPFAVQLGNDRLVLDTPAGLTDALPLSSPRLNELAESLTSASNRILLFGITDADLRRFTQGERLELRRYIVAVTPRRLEIETLSLATFQRFIEDATRELGTAPTETDYMKFLDTQPPGQARLLAEIRRDATGAVLLQGVRLPPKGGFGEKPAYMLATTALLQVRGKALNLQVYSSYDDAQDLEWIRFVTGRWIEDLQRLNR